MVFGQLVSSCGTICQMKKIDSPNHSSRSGKKILGVVIHTTVGTYQGTIVFFQKVESGVSSHYVVSLEGEITQMVEESRSAYHAGILDRPSAQMVKDNGTTNPNLYTIGIENADNLKPADADRSKQYPALIALVRDICLRNQIPIDRYHVIGHREVRASKTCPGNLDVDYIVREANKQPGGTGEGGNMQVMDLLKKYAAITIDDFDRKIFEHVGTTWGNPDAEPSGYLGSERRQGRKWAELVKYLEIPGDPSLTLFEDIQRVIAGMKSRATDLMTQLSTATAEVGNKDEQISRLKEQLRIDVLTQKALYDNEKALRTKAEEKLGVVQGQAQLLQDQVTKYAQDKGQLVIDKTNAENSAKQWEGKYKELLTNGVAQEITFFDALVVLFKSLVAAAKNIKIKKVTAETTGDDNSVDNN